ncbi:DNA cytosine methyltransferase [Streptomyces noursei]|uniref:DNA cytosine methyltransferase n=1 Tax=Streptomyces noursei TaxID=1971 RepID=UPI00363CD131
MQRTETPTQPPLTCVELCAGAGGQSLGLEQAGFRPLLLAEIDPDACATLRANRPRWPVLRSDIRALDVNAFQEAEPDLLAAGVPCPPFSVAGSGLGPEDERDLFPAVVALAAKLRPRAVLIENVRGLLQQRFNGYRTEICRRLAELGYVAEWQLLYASDYGVPQLRPRAILVALPARLFRLFQWPVPDATAAAPVTVGRALRASMAAEGWELADEWAAGADRIAPTLCGGSRRHGGPDLGPSRARQTWAAMGVNAASVADRLPQPGERLPVRLVPEQLAQLQGFPPDWVFTGTKTARCRQIGNAFPPPVADAVGRQLAAVLAGVGFKGPETSTLAGRRIAVQYDGQQGSPRPEGP